jgi:hypothetical protein
VVEPTRRRRTRRRASDAMRRRYARRRGPSGRRVRPRLRMRVRRRRIARWVRIAGDLRRHDGCRRVEIAEGVRRMAVVRRRRRCAMARRRARRPRLVARRRFGCGHHPDELHRPTGWLATRRGTSTNSNDHGSSWAPQLSSAGFRRDETQPTRNREHVVPAVASSRSGFGLAAQISTFGFVRGQQRSPVIGVARCVVIIRHFVEVPDGRVEAVMAAQ